MFLFKRKKQFKWTEKKYCFRIYFCSNVQWQKFPLLNFFNIFQVHVSSFKLNRFILLQLLYASKNFLFEEEEMFSFSKNKENEEIIHPRDVTESGFEKTQCIFVYIRLDQRHL